MKTESEAEPLAAEENASSVQEATTSGLEKKQDMSEETEPQQTDAASQQKGDQPQQTEPSKLVGRFSGRSLD